MSGVTAQMRGTSATPPDEWEYHRLGDICRTTSGGTPSRKNPDYFRGPIPWVKSGELPDGVVSEIEESISEEAIKDSSAKLFPAGTLLIALYGATVGKLGILTRPAATNQAVCAVFPPVSLDTKFLFWYFRFRRDDLVAQAVGGAQPNISQAVIRSLIVHVPPLDDQHSVVAEIEKQFSRLDEGVANLKRVKANLKRYKAAVLKAAVEGRLVPTEAELARREGRSYETAAQLLHRIVETRRDQAKCAARHVDLATGDDTNLPALPEGWRWAPLGQVSNVVRGGSPRPAGDPRYFGGPVPWITVGPITADESDYLREVPEGLTEQGRERSRFVDPHTLLLTNSGATLGVPKISLIGGCINDGVAAILDVDYPLKLYLLHLLRTRTQTMRRINQGAAQPNLNTTIIKSIKVPLPPPAEQVRILAEIDRRLSFVGEIEVQVEAGLLRGERLKSSLLAQAFAGDRFDSVAESFP